MSKSLRFPETSFSEGATFDFFKPRSAEFREVYDFEPSMTRQEFAEDCDINTIMSRYEVTGMLPQAAGQPMYGDFTQVPNLMEALDMMTQAQASFMALPARVRREFDNDPTQFVEFASDPDNLDQMRLWGLAPPAPKEPPQVAPEVSPASPAPASSDAPKGP